MASVTIQLSDIEAATLTAQAQAKGMTLEEWFKSLAEEHVPTKSQAHLQQTDPAEWRRQFQEWVNSHDHITAVIPDEELRRENMYPDRV